MNVHGIKHLAAAVTLQAAKDYIDGTDEKRKQILKDLRSNWMVALTSCLKYGTSRNVADKLEFHLDEVKKNMKELRKENERSN